MSDDEIASALYRKAEAPSGGVAIEPVPNVHWRIDGVEWDERRLRSSSRAYAFIALDAEQVLAQFPEPFLPAVGAAGRTFGGTMIHEAKNGRRTRGGSHSQKREIEEAVRQEFSARRDRGALPDKKEAIYQEAMEWVRAHHDKEISRGTALRYLQPLWAKDSLE